MEAKGEAAFSSSQPDEGEGESAGPSSLARWMDPPPAFETVRRVVASAVAGATAKDGERQGWAAGVVYFANVDR